jgi:hypothetical protein
MCDTHLWNFKVRNMNDDRCYVQLYFYDKLPSLRPSDMFDPSVKKVRCTKFDSIRRETCMIIRGNLLPHPANCCRHLTNCSRHLAKFPVTRTIVACTWSVVACTWPVVVGTDPEFIGFIDLVQLGWIQRNSTNCSTQNRSLSHFTSQSHKHTYQLLCSDTINQI